VVVVHNLTVVGVPILTVVVVPILAVVIPILAQGGPNGVVMEVVSVLVLSL
jgi:hypothetical protein